MAQISHLLRVNAAPDEVFRLVATTEGISGWLTQASSQDYRKGGALDLRFPDQNVSFVISELEAPSRIKWHCTTSASAWFETDIAFEFVARGDKTIVRFDHLGWPGITDLFRDCSMSWAYFLESLRSLVEQGSGTPEQFTDVSPRSNWPAA